MIRLVLFDIDGTLLHTGGVGMKAFARAFASEFGIHDGTERLKFSGRTDVSLVREVFGLNQIEPSPSHFDRFFAAYAGWLREIIVDCQGGPCPGVLEFCQTLENLPEQPLIGLLTGNIKVGARIKLERFSLWEKFPFGGFADDHEDRDQIAAAAHRRGSERFGRALRGRGGSGDWRHAAGHPLRPRHRGQSPGRCHWRRQNRRTGAAQAGLGRAGFVTY